MDGAPHLGPTLMVKPGGEGIRYNDLCEGECVAFACDWLPEGATLASTGAQNRGMHAELH